MESQVKLVMVKDTIRLKIPVKVKISIKIMTTQNRFKSGLACLKTIISSQVVTRLMKEILMCFKEVKIKTILKSKKQNNNISLV